MNIKTIAIYETKQFTKFSNKLLGEVERDQLIEYLKEFPKAGDVIPGSGGIRKLRWSRPGTGKRGGVRVIYYFITEYKFISLLTLYAKNDREDLTKKELNEYRKVAELIESELTGK